MPKPPQVQPEAVKPAEDARPAPTVIGAPTVDGVAPEDRKV